MQKFECKNCGAELYWNINAKALTCDHCNSSYQSEEFGIIITSKVEDELNIDSSSEALTYVNYKCSNCGAEVVAVKGTVATTCAYCGRALVMTHKMTDTFKPDLIIPFSISKRQAIRAYKDYITKLPLASRAFLKPENIKKIKGMYVPFWLHDITEVADIEFIETKHHTVGKPNERQQVIDTNKVTANITREFKRIPVSALQRIDDATMVSIEPFYYNNLRTFSPAYMAGFLAEEHNETAEETLNVAYARTFEFRDEQLAKRFPNMDLNTLKYNATIDKHKAKYVMLPIWVLSVEFKKKQYLFTINGNTGKTTGNVPKNYLNTLRVLIPIWIGYFIISFIINAIK